MAERFTQKDMPANRVYSIRCSDCGVRGEIAPTNAAGCLPPEMVTKKFNQRGWKVGTTPRKDVCPECRKRDSMRIAKVDKNLRAEIIDLHPKKEEPVEPKKTISREDRRIILAKLNEVYQDEKTGYRPGWNDDKVAVDLGVFTKWVADLRAENFGDLPVSAIDQGFLDEARQVLEQIQQVGREAIALRDEARTMMAKAVAKMEEVDKLEMRMDDLLAQEQLLAEQIAKVA